MNNEADNTVYEVVVNREEQYSIWPRHKNLPLGWVAVGKSGLKPDCLSYIKEVWTDMRPLSLRKKMEELEARRPELEREEARRLEEARARPSDPRDDLVEFLCSCDHPVEAWLQPERSVDILHDAIGRGFVHIQFTDTRGGTILGIRLDTNASDLSQAAITGSVHLEGDLTLNNAQVRCIADIELKTLAGRGRLQRVPSA